MQQHNRSNTQDVERARDSRRRIHRQWDRAAIGLALIWAGVAWLLGLGWYAVLTGVGMVLVLEQLLRWNWVVRLDGFWASAGLVAMMAGTAGLLGYQFPVMALALVIGGLVLLGSVLRRSGSRLR